MYETPPPPYGYPAPYAPYAVQPAVRTSVGGLGVALTVLFSLDAVFAVLGTLVLAQRSSLLNRVLNDPASVDQASVDSSDTLVRTVDGLLVLVVLATMVVFICWFWAARNNAELYEPGQGTMRVGWSIGGWFIPFASMVIPCIVARDVYRGTMARRARRNSDSGGHITGWWWASYVVLNVLVLRVSVANGHVRRAQNDGPYEYFKAMRSLAQAGMTALPVLAVSSVLAICYVQAVTKVQRQRNAAGDWYDGPGSRAAMGLPPLNPDHGYGYGYGMPVPGGYPVPAPVWDAVPAQHQVAATQTAETQTAETQPSASADEDPFAASSEDLKPPS